MVEALLSDPVVIKQKYSACLSKALITASRNGHDQIIEVLLCDRLQVNQICLALKMACQEGYNCSVVETLLNHGAQVNQIWEDRKSLLMIASQNGHVQIVKLLLRNHASEDLQDSKGWSALMIAIENGKSRVVNVLLERGADIDLINEDGFTALVISIQNKRFHILKFFKLLLQKGAQKDLQAKNGWSALMIASEIGHHKVVDVLLVKKKLICYKGMELM